MIQQQNKLSVALDWIEDIMAWIAGVCVVAMMLAISYSVVARFVFSAPQPAVIELSGYLLLYTAFLGSPWLLRINGHVQVDLLIARLSPRARRVVDICTCVLGMVVSFVLVWRGLLVTIDSYSRDIKVFNILATPQYLLLMVIPIGGLFLLLEFGRRMGRLAGSGKKSPAAVSKADDSDRQRG